eukprot:262791-Rhodomonas_salina.2
MERRAKELCEASVLHSKRVTLEDSDMLQVCTHQFLVLRTHCGTDREGSYAHCVVLSTDVWYQRTWLLRFKPRAGSTGVRACCYVGSIDVVASWLCR